MTLIFHKMHGLGNDYIYIDGITSSVDKKQILLKLLPFCDRNRGIGSDGIIFLMPSQMCDLRMEMYNIDGGRGEMCGNGARCCVKLASLLKIVKKNVVILETDSGNMEGTIKGDEVFLKMSQKPTISKKKEEVISHDLKWEFYRANIGNPHAVIYNEDLELMDIEKYGRIIENDKKLFPNRTNVEFYKKISKGHVTMRVWERGSGETKACGTGAACVAGVYRYLNDNSMDDVRVDLLGGSLFFKWVNEDFYMQGEVKYVYEGKIII